MNNATPSLVIADSPILKIRGLESKFDVIAVSNSLAFLLGSEREAKLVQQLHFLSLNPKNGFVYEGARWIYKAMSEWVIEIAPSWTMWKLRSAIASLVAKGVLIREHLFDKHHGDNFHKKNRTYYYRLNYDRLNELAREKVTEISESTENFRFAVDHKTGLRNTTKQVCDCPQNRTDITSKENVQKEISPPTPSVEKAERERIDKSAFEEDLENLDNKDPWLTEPKDKSEVKKDKPLVRQKEPSAVTRKKDEIQHTKRKPQRLGLDSELAPWSSIEEFNLFYEALIKALPTVANASCPSAVAKPIVQSLCDGVMHDYWLDWKKGDAIGTAQQQEWHVAPGIAHPMFIEYLAEKLIRGNNTQTREQAIAEALKIARRPQEAIFFWKECKIALGNALSEAERHQALGVQALPTPLWTKERPEPTLEEAAIAGMKIQQINDSTKDAIEAAKNPQIEGGKSQGGALPHLTENTPNKSDSHANKKPRISDYAPERVKRFLARGSKKPKGFSKR